VISWNALDAGKYSLSGQQGSEVNKSSSAHWTPDREKDWSSENSGSTWSTGYFVSFDGKTGGIRKITIWSS
jgi:hypothetical protein